MKNWMMIAPVILMAACGSDSEYHRSLNVDLNGTWISNCHEFIDSETNERIAYSIDSYTFSDGEFSQTSVSYEDHICRTETGAEDNWYGTYSLGAAVLASDGLEVNRITLDITSDEWLGESQYYVSEVVFRITADQLNFGAYLEGETPELASSITYTKVSPN